MRTLLIYIIRGYQVVLSPDRGLLGGVWQTALGSLVPELSSGCRDETTCSAYAVETLTKEPLGTALLLIVRRISKCHL